MHANLKDMQIQAKLFIALQPAFLSLLGSHDLCQLEQFGCRQC